MMMWKDSNTLGLTEYLRHEGSPDVLYNETGITLFFMPKLSGSISEIMRNGTAEEQLRDLSKYFKPYFGVQKHDWFVGEFKTEKIKAKMCDASDFDYDDVSRKNYESFKDYVMFCPDHTNIGLHAS